jgi:uncharacterized RDD family membrane protein YckC
MYRPAGFWIRLGAGLLDGLIVSAIFGLIYSLITGGFSPKTSSFINLLEVLYAILIPVFWNGYVLGKRIAGIRIVKVDGSDVTFPTMLMRVLVGGLIYTVTLGIALIISAFMVGTRDDKRAIHDLIAGTFVTYAKPGETG